MSFDRRSFLFHSGLLGLAAMAGACRPEEIAESGSASMVLAPDEGETWFIGTSRQARVTILVSGNEGAVPGMSLLAEYIPPGDGIPEHKHRNEDEFIWIHSGSAAVSVGDQVRQLEPGGLAYISKGTWHGLKNEGKEAVTMFFGYTPAGFEDYFRAIGVKEPDRQLDFSQREWDLISERYGVEYR